MINFLVVYWYDKLKEYQILSFDQQKKMQYAISCLKDQILYVINV